MDELITTIESLGWAVEPINETLYSLEQQTPFGQSLLVCIESGEDVETFVQNLYHFYQQFDVSHETYHLLNEEGHGVSGSPYDLQDVYLDVQAWHQSLYNLCQSLVVFTND